MLEELRGRSVLIEVEGEEAYLIVPAANARLELRECFQYGSSACE